MKTPKDAEEPNEIRFANFHLNRQQRSVFVNSNVEVHLEPKEFAVLELLALNLGLWLSFEEVVNIVGQLDVNQYRNRLRNKLAAHDEEARRYLESRYGGRIRLFVPVDAPSGGKSAQGRSETYGPHGDRPPTLVQPKPAVSLLQLYYSDADLRAQDLFRYSYAVNGRRVVTNMATKDLWLGLALPISERSWDRFPIEEPKLPWPVTPQARIDELRAELAAKKIRFENRPIYALRSFAPKGEHAIASFSNAQYVNYKLELGRLEEETLQALTNTALQPDIAYDRRRDEMPLREKLLRNSEVLARYPNRLCAGGTNILLAFRISDRDDFMFILKRRSGGVSTGRHVMSLIPSGMHQSSTYFVAQEETSVAATVYREMDEELFGGEEVDPEDRSIEPLQFMRKPHLAWFQQNPNAFTLEIVSFGLNLVDGTFEFGVLLVVNDPTYWDQYGEEKVVLNEEFDKTIFRPFYTHETNRLLSVMTSGKCADTSLIALVEGLRRLQQLEPARVSTIEITR